MTSTLKVDQIQLADGTAPTAAALGFAAGSVLQTVHEVGASTQINLATAGTWTNLIGSATITPTSANSKILVIMCQSFIGNNCLTQGVRILRTIGSTDTSMARQEWYNNGTIWQGSVATLNHLDSPNTTSAITYRMQGYAQSVASQAARYNYQYQIGSDPQITLMEIAG